MTPFACPQCGAPITVTPRISFHSCEFCGTISFIDRSGVMFYYVMPFLIDENQARMIFNRWLKNPHMAKDLSITAKITQWKKILFPVYIFRRMVGGEEKSYIRPAKGTLIEGMQNLIIPPGSMKIYDKNTDIADATKIDPDITMDVYASNLPGTEISQALLYFSLYQVEYEFNDAIWMATIEGSQGAVHATTYPMRSSLPFGMVFFVGFMAGLLGIILGIYIHIAFFVLILAGIIITRIMANSVVGTCRTTSEG
jgi:hypothetical protein